MMIVKNENIPTKPITHQELSPPLQAIETFPADDIDIGTALVPVSPIAPKAPSLAAVTCVHIAVFETLFLVLMALAFAPSCKRRSRV